MSASVEHDIVDALVDRMLRPVDLLRRPSPEQGPGNALPSTPSRKTAQR